MPATYDSTLPNDRNWVRFLVGDITPSRALLQDDEIDGVLEEEALTVTVAAALKYFAAARCVDIIHTRYATAGAYQGGVMMKRVDDLARSFGVSASTSAALDEKTRDLRKRGARLLTSSRSHFFRSMSVVVLAGIASIFGDTTPAAHAQSYFWLQFLAPVANSAALPACSDGSVYERRSIVTLAPSPGSIYQCPDGGGSWTCMVGADCPATGTVTSAGLSMPSGFSVSGSPITGSGTFTVSWSTQTANRVLAGPTSGGAATPSFRAITAADLGSGSATSSTYLRGDMTWAALSSDPTLTGDVDGLGSANDLDEAAVETELEAVLDLVDLQGDLPASRVTDIPAGVTDHGALTGLSDDDHSQYSLLAGRAGGQILTGTTGSSGWLRLAAHATGGSTGRVYFTPDATSSSFDTIELVIGGSPTYNTLIFPYGKSTQFYTCAGVAGSFLNCTADADHFITVRGVALTGNDGTFTGIALRGFNSSASGLSNQFVGLQLANDSKIGWVNAANLTFSPAADLLIDRDRASMLRVSSTTDGTGGATLLIVPTDTAPTCNKKGIQWERASEDALCRCNGSTWSKIDGAGTCP